MTVRDAFFRRLYERTRSGEDIVIVSSDIGAPSLDDFRKDFPDRFVNVGIAEQNALAVAAGLSVTGKKVITYGLNPFPVTRGFDHLRNLLSSKGIPVTVTALNAGSCSAEAGYTHMAVENMSVMRTLKGIRIVNPTDELIAERLADEIIDNPKPMYVQFDKYINGRLYSNDDISFEKGFVSYGEDNDTLVVSYGIFVRELIQIGVKAKIIDCFCLPVSEERLIDNLRRYERIFCVEDGVGSGGIGSMLLEIMNRNGIQKNVIIKSLRFAAGYPHHYINRSLLWDKESITPERLATEINGGAA